MSKSRPSDSLQLTENAFTQITQRRSSVRQKLEFLINITPLINLILDYADPEQVEFLIIECGLHNEKYSADALERLTQMDHDLAAGNYGVCTNLSVDLNLNDVNTCLDTVGSWGFCVKNILAIASPPCIQPDEKSYFPKPSVTFADKTKPDFIYSYFQMVHSDYGRFFSRQPLVLHQPIPAEAEHFDYENEPKKCCIIL